MQEPENQQLYRFIDFDPKNAKIKKKKENLPIGKANFEEVEGESFPTKSAHYEIENFLRPSEMKFSEFSKEKTNKCYECSSKEHSLQYEVDNECLNCQGNTRTSEKKKIKETDNSTKAAILSKSQLVSPIETKKKYKIWESTPVPSEFFKKEHPELCQNGNIYFPIEDQLFIEFQNEIQPYLVCPTEYQIKELPTHFEYILDVWNLLETFPENFANQKQALSFKEVESLLLDDTELLSLVSRILDVFVQDLIADKNEMIKKSKHYDFFSLIKFCAENLFLNKIYEKCWPNLAIAFFEFFEGDDLNEKNSVIIQILQEIAAKCFGKCPEKIELRAKIVSELTKLLSESNEFRRIVQEKGDWEKKQSKKLLELEEKKKKLSKEISKQAEQEKSLQKEYRMLNKQKQGQHDLDEKNNENKVGEKLLLAEQLRTLKTERMLKLEEIEEELANFEKNKSKVTHVELLGTDKNNYYYWNLISGFDGVFVDCAGKWVSIDRDQVKGLMGSLNLRGTRENQLYKALENFLNAKKRSTSLPISIELNHLATSTVASTLECTESSEAVLQRIFSFIRELLIDSESRIASYLEERNSRWCTSNEREQFFTFVNQIESMILPEILEALRNFNEKICVVETEYKIINESSAEEIDTKTRKVQTKIWGISEKYKCHWTQFSHQIQSLHELFFLILALNLNIEKYTSKNRKKRKEFEVIKEQNRLIKTNSCRRDELLWEETCEICKQGGELLCCDICPKVFHLECLGLEEIGMIKFECEGCGKSRDLRGLLRRSKA